MGKKELVLKDLLARLPYGVVIKEEYGDYINVNIHNANIEHLIDRILAGVDMMVLRPMASFEDEEKTQVQMFMDIVTDENYGDGYSPSAWDAMNGFVQYCDSHHLDHRGLIEKGLALPAPEGMY